MRAWAILIVLLGVSCAKKPAVSEREAATELLAKHLATAAKPKSVLVLSNPYTQMSGRPAEVYQFERAGIAGLKKGFGEKIPVKIDFPKLSKEAVENPGSVNVDPKTTTPLSFLVAESAFQEVVDKNNDCDLVISLIGLPVNLASFPSWSKQGSPRFGLFLPDWRIIGNREAIQNAFQSGKLIAAVVRRPGVPEKTPPDQRFILVTAGNIEQLLGAQPQLFEP